MPWHGKNLLPFAGGVLDQPESLLRSLAQIDYMVAWHMQNEQRTDPDSLPGIADLDT